MEDATWVDIIEGALRKARMRSRSPEVTAWVLQQALLQVGIRTQAVQRKLWIDHLIAARVDLGWHQGSHVHAAIQGGGGFFVVGQPGARNWDELLRNSRSAPSGWEKVLNNRAVFGTRASFDAPACPIAIPGPKGAEYQPLIFRCAATFREHNLVALWPNAEKDTSIDGQLWQLVEEIWQGSRVRGEELGQALAEALRGQGVEAAVQKRVREREIEGGTERREQIFVATSAGEWHCSEGGAGGGQVTLEWRDDALNTAEGPWQEQTTGVSASSLAAAHQERWGARIDALANQIVLQHLDQATPAGKNARPRL